MPFEQPIHDSYSNILQKTFKTYLTLDQLDHTLYFHMLGDLTYHLLQNIDPNISGAMYCLNVSQSQHPFFLEY